jgi:hypothetical protein
MWTVFAQAGGDLLRRSPATKSPLDTASEGGMVLER